MGIKKNEYRNFYFGTGIEYFFVSQFYLMGYEAYTTNPDIGYDLVVTNQCRMKYRNEEVINYNIQIKSSIRIKNFTKFYISIEDFNMLENNKNAALICAYHKPIMEADPCSLVYDRTNSIEIDKILEKGFMENFIEDYHSYSIEDAERNFKFIDFNVKYFWLNSEHLKRLKKEKFFTEGYDSKGNKYWILKIKFEKEIKQEQVILVREDQDIYSQAYIVPEIESVYYLLNDNRNKSELQKGKLFIEDNEKYH